MAKAGRNLNDYLLDLQEWIENVRHVEQQMQPVSGIHSRISELALARALEVTGEICGRLISEYPDWAADRRKLGLDDAYRLRNKIIHGYDSLDVRLLLVIAREDIPRLKAALSSWLAEIHG